MLEFLSFPFIVVTTALSLCEFVLELDLLYPKFTPTLALKLLVACAAFRLSIPTV